MEFTIILWIYKNYVTIEFILNKSRIIQLNEMVYTVWYLKKEIRLKKM